MNIEEEISKVAYELYEKSGMVHGREEEHWLAAEKKILEASKSVRKRKVVKKTAVARAPKKARAKKSL